MKFCENHQKMDGGQFDCAEDDPTKPVDSLNAAHISKTVSLFIKYSSFMTI